MSQFLESLVPGSIWYNISYYNNYVEIIETVCPNPVYGDDIAVVFKMLPYGPIQSTHITRFLGRYIKM